MSEFIIFFISVNFAVYLGVTFVRVCISQNMRFDPFMILGGTGFLIPFLTFCRCQDLEACKKVYRQGQDAPSAPNLQLKLIQANKQCMAIAPSSLSFGSNSAWRLCRINPGERKVLQLV
jgi:hypothetical protein